MHTEMLSIDSISERTYLLKPNVLNKLDGTQQEFFSSELLDFNQYSISDRYWYFWSLYFSLTDKIEVYNERFNYQPILESVDGVYISDDSSNLMSNTYLAFYIMAQLGGLYTFLSLLISPILKRFSKISFLHAAINTLYQNAFVTDPSDCKENDVSSRIERLNQIEDHSQMIVPMKNISRLDASSEHLVGNLYDRPNMPEELKDDRANQMYEGGNDEGVTKKRRQTTKLRMEFYGPRDLLYHAF